ncbi:ASB_HP2_G0033290.mRNA.1.CDS.1 [Saccharomyces cerevisiae]|nr:Mbr1p [Saccharomyces cerevisiae YJM244]CAI4574267.1 AHG_G0032380.mRNA.1.CDS.1 [Saccharomyces cerevisiae]CAI4575777.1 BGN_3a_G0032350.mRNA.1.CDS.1 [Saccharomyces cerevisiae]CAI5297594.1 ASB_HP2_G0033290.mRNA.1.CDS.1 [Saccharomyces cerevisiae]CAI5312829.1 CIH_HP2_G0031220.mRNA.1.CDS.1 [Saccharomyces cerevisiae]
MRMEKTTDKPLSAGDMNDEYSRGPIDDIDCLNFFERAVQDPCCEACDTEDADEELRAKLSSFNFQPDSSPCNAKCQQTLNPLCKIDEGLPAESELAPSRNGSVSEANSDTNSIASTVHDPVDSKYGGMPSLRKAKTTSYFTSSSSNNTTMRNPLKKCNTNINGLLVNGRSSSSSRQSIPELFSGACTKKKNNVLLKSETPNSEFSTNSLQHCNSRSFSLPRSRSRSSAIAIPTHLYGLEKYVSPELDTLTADPEESIERFSNNRPREISSCCPNDTGDTSSSLSHSNTSSSLNFPLGTNTNQFHQPRQPVQQQQSSKPNFGAGRKKSFIEMSLASSFAG